MSVPNRFTAIAAVPQEGLDPYQALLFNQVKENLELLSGFRGESDRASKAVTQGQITTQSLSEQNMRQVTAQGTGFTISGNNVAGLDDFVKLINNVQVLANDLKTTRDVINSLLAQMKGT